jgi:hypothetical protein
MSALSINQAFSIIVHLCLSQGKLDFECWGKSTQFLRNFTTLYLQLFNILETAEELEILELTSEPKKLN